MIYIFLYKIEFYYMCVKLPPRDLNLNPSLSHSTITYTCEVTITPMVYSGRNIYFVNHYLWFLEITTKHKRMNDRNSRINTLACM